jgi:hypothetical protein
MAKTIYALLVGINQYQSSPTLTGCVNDANNFKAYLQEAATRTGATLKAQLLTDAQASRPEIVKTFLQHLGQAGKDDVALFFFSGHGTLEGAHAAFKQTEKDDTIETLVCHDFFNVNGLADKELRYLIKKISGNKPHVVIITDCCHSGDITRQNRAMVKQLPHPQSKSGLPFGQRKWSEFIFANEITEAQALAASKLDNVLPQGNHIHLAACEAQQLAFAFEDGSVFTNKLLEVLHQSSGNITYQDLYTRLATLTDTWYQDTDGNTVHQTPQIYVVEQSGTTPITEAPAVLYQRFLGGLVEGEPIQGSINYHPNNATWQLGLGAVHGIPPFGLEKIKVDALDNQSNAVLATAQITEVFPNHCTIQFVVNAGLSKDKTYGAYVRNVFTSPLLFSITGNAAGVNELGKYYNTHRSELHRANVFATNRGNILNAYRIVAQNSQYELVYAANKLPVARQVEGYQEASVNAIFAYLKHIARWQYIKCFQNTVPATSISPKDIALKVLFKTPVGSEQLVVFDAKNKGAAGYAQVPPKESLTNAPSGSIKVAITNSSSFKQYHCALAYLGQLFDIVTDTLSGASVLVEPCATVFASVPLPNGNRSEWIGLVQEAFIKQYNYPATTFGLLLVVSDKPISLNAFQQDALPPPKTETRENETIEVQERALPSPPKWASVYYEVNIPNPYFNLVH